MTTSRAPRHLLPAALLVALLATGCGSDDRESSADPSAPAASTADTASTSPSASPSASTSASTSAAPAAGAATGPVVESEVVTVNLPDEWELDEVNSDDKVVIGYDPATGADMSFTFFEAASGTTLDRYERAARKTWSYETGPKVRPRVDVNGVEMFHHTGSKGAGRSVASFGTPYDGVAVEIEFYLPSTIPGPEQRELIDSVLASVAWK